MSILKKDIRGLVHEYPHRFVIGREKIREYARAIKVEDPASYDEAAAAELGYPTVVAPLTFPAILALLVQQDFFRTHDIGVETMQIVQVDQKFVYHRPMMVGEILNARMEVQSVDERFGADIVVTRNVCVNDAGEVVLEAYTTMMGHEGDGSIQAKWDPETGQVVRTAN